MFTIRNASWFYYNTTVSNTIFYNVSMTSGQVYQFNWTPKNSSGTTSDIYIYANNSDASNFQTNVTFRYYLDEVAPTTPLIYPQSLNNSAGSTINGTTTVTVGTSDSLSGVKDVRFYIAEQGNATVFNYSDTVAPYIWELDTHKFAEGNYTINVTVEDNVGLFNEISFVVIFNNTREATYTVTDNTLDLRETPFKNQIYQLTNLNSTTVDITVAKTALKTTITQLPTTYYYMNISGSTPQTSRVYFKLPTDTIATADFSRLYGFSDHNDDDSYEEGIPATYLNQVDDYYQFYFTTSGFSLFGIGLVAADAAESETSTSTSTSATQSTATVDTLDKKTSIWSEISTGESVSMNVGSSKIDISTITFMPKSDLTDVELVVKSYKEKPGAVSEVEGTVHQYMSIDAAGITDGDFDSATIEFRLTKDWLADNGLAAGDMALYRYSGGSWTKLDSSYDGEQGVYYTYSASTPGFSYFAVSGMPVTEEEVVEEVEVEEETPPVVEELPEEDDNIAGKAAEPSEAEEGKGKYFYILGILVILILVGYAFWKKKE